MRNDARFLTYKILNHYENNNTKLSDSINHIFLKYKPNNLSKSRSKILSNEIVRFMGRLDLMIEYISGKKIDRIELPVLSLLRIGFYEINLEQNVPEYAAVDSVVKIAKNNLHQKAKGFVNAVLRNLTKKIKLNPDWNVNLKIMDEWLSIPNWIKRRWEKQFGVKNAIKLVKKINRRPLNYIRIETNLISIRDVEILLLEEGINAEKYSNIFLKISNGFRKILKMELFKRGIISIQNPASAGAVNCLDVNPGEKILDVCAAPGTKTLYLSNLVGSSGKIFASDILKKRVDLGILDMKRHGRKNIKWDVKDASKDVFPMIDKIFIDAPCSGTGVIGRKPDIKWRIKPNDLVKMSSKQLGILENCKKYLNLNGVIVYSTCSLEQEENWNVVVQFLNLNKNFVVDKLPIHIQKKWIDSKGCYRTLPHLHNLDGMFAVRLKKIL